MDTLMGASLCVLAGVCVGTFLLPLKLSRRWVWENSWLIGSAVMFLILPVAEAWLLIPATPQVLAYAGARSIFFSFLAGLGQGTAALVFTYGVTLMGLSLGYSVMVSMIIVFSTMIPLCVGHPGQLTKPGGITLIVGICLIILGSAMAGVAGKKREAIADRTLSTNSRRSTGLGWMIFISIYVGIAASLNYFVLEFQSGITKAATIQYGVSPALAPVIVLLPWYIGNFILIFAYCIFKMVKDGTLKNYFTAGPDLKREYLLAISIGILWYLGQGVMYLAGFQELGVLGVPVGAALFMASTIVTSNVTGFLTKEWENAPRRILVLMCGSVAFLLLGVVVIGIGNHFS